MGKTLIAFCQKRNFESRIYKEMFVFNRVEKVAISFLFLSIALVAILFGISQNSKERQNIEQKQTQATISSRIKKLQVGQSTIDVEIADSDREITRGLSFRESLDQNSGLYFILPQRKQVSFWMYGMKFPLDIIWIDNGRVVGIEENAPVPTSEDIPTFDSPQAVTHVLEVNAGFADQNNIKTGDKVTPP